MKLNLSDAAQSDLREIAFTIEDRGGTQSVAEAFVQDIVTRCQRVAALSGTLGTDRSDLRAGIRSTPHRGYLILFRYADDTVEIVNILHAGRDVTVHYSDD